MFADRLGLRRLLSWEAVLGAALVLVAVLAGLFVDGFASSRNVADLLLDLVPIALIALPMTLIIVTGEIDLSVASTLGLTSSVLGALWLANVPLELGVLLCLLLGAALGALNGVFVTAFGLPSLAVTIGTLALYRGLATVVLGDQAVADFPREWTQGIASSVPGTPIPWVFALIVLLAVGFGVLLHATPVGRGLYAMGNSPDAARFAGVSVGWTKYWLYVACGVISALAGIFWTFRYASARADNGGGLELTVVAAVLLGGVSIFGGRGRLAGVALAVVLVGALNSALRLADVSSDALTIVTGTLLILSVVGPAMLRRGRRASP
ncbi:ABC transporter permease [Flindersiella endophytica]